MEGLHIVISKDNGADIRPITITPILGNMLLELEIYSMVGVKNHLLMITCSYCMGVLNNNYVLKTLFIA